VKPGRFVWTWLGFTVGALVVLFALRAYALRIYTRDDASE